MKPYYSDDFVTIYHADCRELLSSVGPMVDAIVTDPPYGETSLEWDRWPGGWPDEATAVPRAAPMWCFGSQRMWLERGGEFAASGWRFAQDVIWLKHNGSGFHADRFKRVHESVLQWYRGDWADVYKSPVYTLDAVKKQVRKKGRPTHTGHLAAPPYRSEDGGPRLQRSVIPVRSCHGHAQHPTQKPLGIITPLLEYSVPRGGWVLDPFAGSGSTLRAAKDGGWHAIGIEIDERYCEIAARRLSQEVLDFGGVA